MLRNLEIVVDSQSWAPKRVPRELLSCAGPRQVNVLVALIYTALVTRPPTVHGFHLSDYWAWLRYQPAIAATNDLRLRAEWDTVDSHQKTVLSDELGVGFTTQFITEALNCSEFTDTVYPNSTSILPTTILKQSFVDGAQYLLLFLSQGDHTSESKAALGIA